MTEPEIDKDGYPTEETLEVIRNWPMHKGYDSLIRFIEPIFERYGAFEHIKESDTYKISTGGWSGCEDAISALQDNKMFWMAFWRSSFRGGHYEFCLKDL